MNQLFLLAGAVLLHLFHAKPAQACGPHVPEVFPLLPQDGAEAVPLNAVLTAAANYEEPRFTLRVVKTTAATLDGGAPDGGAAGLDAAPDAGALTVTAECERGSSTHFCRAKIDGQLHPNTDYEWTVSNDGVDSPGWHRFRTGDTEAARHTPPDIPVRVVLNDYVSGEFCYGPEQIALEFDADHVDRPYVVDVFGLNYHSWSYARVIEPGIQPVRTDFSDRADCVDVAAFDIIGERYDLRRVCFDDELSPTVISDAGVVNLPDAGIVNLSDASNGEKSSDREASVKDSRLDGADGGGTPKALVDARAPQLSDAGNSSNSRDAEVAEPPAELPKSQPRRSSGGCSVTSSLPRPASPWLWCSIAIAATGLFRRRRSVSKLDRLD